MDAVEQLAEADFSSYLVGPSALDRYFGYPAGGEVWVETEGSLVDLSRTFEGLLFPGAEYFDAALERKDRLYLFRCVEKEENSRVRIPQATLQGTFRYDIGRNAYLDPCNAYHDLRSGYLVAFHGTQDDTAPYSRVPAELRSWYIAAEKALLVSRFGYKETSPEQPEQVVRETARETAREEALLTPFEQRFVLNGVLTGKNASAGLQVLMDSGFIAAHWPLLAGLDEVHHSKEHHPEGNVWRHTLEALMHRKVRELHISLGLLLHDVGKISARETNGNRFDRHAQIGSHTARRFLEALNYPGDTINDVEFLVKYHMVPGALSQLPVYRTEQVMSSPLFPDLLELYRCDVSSTFRGPDGYYRACRTYRSFLKNRHNPFRTSDGKKRLRLLVD